MGPRPEARRAAGLALLRWTPALKAGLKREGKSCSVVCAFLGFGGVSWEFWPLERAPRWVTALRGNAPVLPSLFRSVPAERPPRVRPHTPTVPPDTHPHAPVPPWGPVQAPSVSVCPADAPPQRHLLSKKEILPLNPHAVESRARILTGH